LNSSRKNEDNFEPFLLYNKAKFFADRDVFPHLFLSNADLLTFNHLPEQSFLSFRTPDPHKDILPELQRG